MVMAPRVVSARQAVARRARVVTLALLAGLSLVVSTGRPAGAFVSDECINAPAITAVSYDETILSATVTTNPNDPLQSCTVGGPNRNVQSFWYRYVAPASGMLSVVAASSPFPGDPATIITVY